MVRTGFEPATYGFQIRRSNHSATLPIFFFFLSVVEGSKVFLQLFLVHSIFQVSSVNEISTCFDFLTLTYRCLIFLSFSGFSITRQHFVESLTTLCPLITSKILPIGRKNPQYQLRRKTGQWSHNLAPSPSDSAVTGCTADCIKACVLKPSLVPFIENRTKPSSFNTMWHIICHLSLYQSDRKFQMNSL